MTRDGSTHISLGEASRFWLKLGFISFGGPAGQIAIMHRELVERRRWVGEQRFLHALNYCMLLPGPEAQQLAIYIGWLLHRAPGGIIAGAFFVIPSVLILLALSYVYAAFGSVPAIASIFAGVKPVVVAIVVEAVIRLGRRSLRRAAHLLISGGSFLAIFVLDVPFPWVVLGAGLLALASMRLRPDLLAAPAAASSSSASTGMASESSTEPILLHDEAPAPAHARPSPSRSWRILGAGVMLWVLPFVLVIAAGGWSSLHARQYRFFTQAALVTFGGAYAVLAYVTQAAVETHGWITHAQALDGLALAETTPGPLIMVLQFVGFMAGWNHPEGMDPVRSGVLGALVTTWTTFLPGFVLVLLGAPYIEKLRANRDLTGALSGVTAAVVGVILNLALVLGSKVILPAGISGAIDWLALWVMLAALGALYHLKIGVLWVVLGGALLGLLRVLIRI